MSYVTLPRLQARWVDAILGAPVPAETEADCDNCVMVPPPGERMGPTAFHPETRCCTYTPTLANFLVGGLLSDPDPALEHGRTTVRARIAAGGGVTPVGLAPPGTPRILYEHAASKNPLVFGRAASLRCPHYLPESGGCGVWAWREATCATWFCKHVRGPVGLAFWLALRDLLQEAERNVSLWCVGELCAEPEVVGAILSPPSGFGVDGEELDGGAAAGVRWGAWAGREEAFYREAYARVEALSWADVRAIGGVRLHARERVLRAAWARLTDRGFPPVLRAGVLGQVEIGPEWTRLVTYRPYDPLEAPTELLQVLPRFDGRPTEVVLAEVEAELGLSLDEELLRRLLDFGVLTPEG